MVEAQSFKEDSAIEDSISWKDFQGLIWMLSDEFNTESKKTTYACAYATIVI